MQQTLLKDSVLPAASSAEPGNAANWASALDVLGHGIGIFDPSQALRHWNDQFTASFGYPADLCRAGTTLRDLLRFEERALIEMGQDVQDLVMREREAANRGDVFQGVRVGADGQCRIVSMRPLDDGGLVRAVFAVPQGLSGLGAVQGEGSSPPTESDARAKFQSSEIEAVDALEAMGDAFVYFDADDRLMVCNEKYRTLYDVVTRDVAVGEAFESLLRAAVQHNHIDLEDRSPSEYIAWRLDMRRFPTARFDLRLRDGRCLRVSERRTRNGGVVSVHTDVTELKERENALRAIGDELARQNVLFDAALNNMVQGLCMFDDNQRLIVVNRRYLEMYNFSAQVVKPGITLREIMEYSVALGNYTQDDGDRALAERPSQAAKREQDVTLQKLRDGRVIAVMHSPLPNGGSVATYEDVTQRERSESTLRDYAARLEDSNKELQAFAFVASHDLQEPLRKIESFGDRLKAKYGDALGSDGTMYIDRMHNAAGRMRRLITDLLRYSRVTTQAQPFEPVELARIVNEVVSDLQIAIEESGATIDVAPLPIIEADATQVRQLFQNIFSNSLKFRKEDVPPKISVAGRLESNTDNPDDPVEYCTLTICDNGIGFDNKYADRIFAIFQRLHGKTEYGGTGIGLATVRKIVDRHRGTIVADGIPGEGATFTIVVPAQQASQEQHP